MNGPIDTYPFEKKVPAGDNRERHVCGDCGWIHYRNPQIVVGAVVVWQGKFLLCKRAIEPRHGYWTIPAGYLEENESTADGAKRETFEEATAKIEIGQLLAVYDIARISQVQLIYTATLADGQFAPGEESLETRLYDWSEIPWDELAFPTVRWALEQYDQIKDRDAFAPFTNPGGNSGSFRV